jgi:glycosyltransferase involved in cell wall biosynthesis
LEQDRLKNQQVRFLMETSPHTSRPDRSRKGKPAVLLVGNFSSPFPGARTLGTEWAEKLAAAGWPVIRASDQTKGLPRLANTIFTIYQRRRDFRLAQVELFSGRAFRGSEIVCRALRALRKPYILTLHGGGLPAWGKRRPSPLRSLLGSAAAVTAPSEYLRQAMAPYRSEIRVIPNPIELGAYPFRRRPTPEPRLVWLRAFHRIYNPLLAWKTLALVQKRFPASQLAMFGPDKKDGSLEAVKKLIPSGRSKGGLSLHGPIPRIKVPSRLNQSDIFLNTASIDNMPISVIEAMACGLCLVSTNVGGIPQMLDHEENALLVDPEDPSSMARAVNRLLTEPDLADRLSRGARQKAEQHDWKLILPRWEALLEEVASRA